MQYLHVSVDVTSFSLVQAFGVKSKSQVLLYIRNAGIIAPFSSPSRPRQILDRHCRGALHEHVGFNVSDRPTLCPCDASRMKSIYTTRLVAVDRLVFRAQG